MIKPIATAHYSSQDYYALSGMPLSVFLIPVQIGHRFHDHDATELVVVTRGRGWHATGEEQYAIEAGDVFVIREREKHAYRDTHGLALYNVLFDRAQFRPPILDLEQLTGYRALFSLEPRLRSSQKFRSRLKLSPADLTVVCDLFANIAKEQERKQSGYQFMATALFMQAVGFLARCYSNIEDPESRLLLRLGAVLDHMDAALDQPIRLNDLARLANMSQSTFQRAFRRAMNTSPVDYLIRLRIQKACTLLSRGEQNVTEVATATGFDDSNYFTRQFRRITGSSPSAFRRRSAGCD